MELPYNPEDVAKERLKNYLKLKQAKKHGLSDANPFNPYTSRTIAERLNP
jgi:hypothetical protein